ncbi:MAG: sulfatase-like hydrolase/transferase, partial [Candidatus Lokiarchaeota archaeon]|nr:sulfatase-like hydrolase/transferase [Candidatus Lokiarchaeota archaeon]
AEVVFVDEQLGILFDYLKKNNLNQNTLVILTSDHGESLDEHGIYFDHHGLYDVNIKVPLVIGHSDLPESRLSGFIQHTDLMPTILDFIGVESKIEFDGQNILPLILSKMDSSSEIIITEEAYTQRKRSVRDKKYKYIKSFSKESSVCRYCGVIHGGLEELYDLENDPDEILNLINERPEIAKEMKEKLRKWFKSIEERYS